MSSSDSSLATRAHELERQIQSAAFDLLRQEAAYDQAQGLLLIASDVNKIAGRLQELFAGSAPQPSRLEPAARSSKPRKGQQRYPVFFVSGDKLVKLGKGKRKSATEYRHEATHKAFNAVSRWIESTTLSGSREWQARTAQDELQGKVPAYQVYLIIAALQVASVVNQVRRGEYSLADGAKARDEWWQQLEALPVPASEDGEQ